MISCRKLEKKINNSQKTMKFLGNLADLILEGKKTTTWRLFDDKDLQTGDVVSFIRRPELIPFAEARLAEVYEKPLGELTKEDGVGHESYSSLGELCTTFSQYYSKPVTPKTMVKIIKFELLPGHFETY